MPADIAIRVNGEARRVAEATDVAAFVRSLGLVPQRLLIEYNGAPLPRDRWEVTSLVAGDRLEFFQVSAGG